MLHISRLFALAKWIGNEDGATTAEYALILTLVVLILISSLSALGAALNDKLRGIIDQIILAK